MDPSAPVEKWISDLVYLGGNGVAWAVYLFAGVRLYLLSQRTRQAPELLIALTFLFWVLSYLFYDLPYAVVRVEALVPAVCAYASLIALALGNVALALFIRAVFRRGARWATWLVGAIAVCSFVGVVGSGWVGDWEGINPLANRWYWLEWSGGFVPVAWMSAEGFAQYFRARRRLKLGLCEPLACNRFLLWGIAGALWMMLEAISSANDYVNALTGRWSELLNFGVAVFEAVPVAVICLVFFPPAAYRRWLERRAGPAADAAPTVD